MSSPRRAVSPRRLRAVSPRRAVSPHSRGRLEVDTEISVRRSDPGKSKRASSSPAGARKKKTKVMRSVSDRNFQAMERRILDLEKQLAASRSTPMASSPSAILPRSSVRHVENGQPSFSMRSSSVLVCQPAAPSQVNATSPIKVSPFPSEKNSAALQLFADLPSAVDVAPSLDVENQDGDEPGGDVPSIQDVIEVSVTSALATPRRTDAVIPSLSPKIGHLPGEVMMVKQSRLSSHHDGCSHLTDVAHTDGAVNQDKALDYGSSQGRGGNPRHDDSRSWKATA